jgi:hypothetical protein
VAGLIAMAVVLVIPLLVFFDGLVLKTLWVWFLVPIGLPAIGVATAIGVSIIAHMLAASTEGKKDEEEGWGHIIGVLLRPGWALLFGWVVHHFV